MSIVFRTNCNGTLGHVARCRHLARALHASGAAPSFLLDRADPALPSGWLDGVPVHGVYPPGSPGFIDEADDAQRTIARLRAAPPRLIVLDDYRLGLSWETSVRELGVRVAVIDDLRRVHAADLLVEPRPESTPDARRHPPGLLTLSGPGYALLDPALHPRPDARPPTRPTIVLSLGGGGDLGLLASVAHALLVAARAQGVPLLLRPVVGPQASNAGALRALAAEWPDHVRTVEGASSLAEALGGCDLFVGAAGTAVYELAACRVPALTFALAPNQCGESAIHEAVGHYFHVDELDASRHDALASAALTLLATSRDEPERLRALRETATNPVDTDGARRVAEVVASLLEGGPAAARGRVTAPKPPAPLAAGAEPTPERFRVRPCEDRDINRYVEARNLPANRANMTSELPVERLEHYRWWFRTGRSSFLVELDGEPQLWIWHERLSTPSGDVLVGGWFVCREAPDLAGVMAALKWQLAHTDRVEPGVPWVAVIRRGNEFVHRMNLRMGFRDVAPGSPGAEAVRHCFPEAGSEAFHYLVRDANVASAVIGGGARSA